MKKDPELIEDFKEDLFPVLKKRLEFALLLAIFLVPAFSWVDYFFYPDHFNRFLIYRLVTSGLALVLFLLSRKSSDLNAARSIAVSGYYIIGLCIILMIKDVNGFGTPYYAGLLLLFIGFLTFLPFDVKTHFIHTLMLYTLYLLVALYSGRGNLTRLFFVNNIFLLSSLGVLLVGVYFNYRKRFEEFEARRRLQAAERKLREYAEKLEDSVVETESKYETVVKNAREGIMAVRDSQKIVFWNPEAERLFSCCEESLEKKKFFELFPEESGKIMERACRDALKTGEIRTVDPLEIICEEGDTRWIEAMAIPVKWQSGPAALFFIRDITAKRTLERELIQAQKMEAVGTLASGVAHDLNNIFQIIAGYVQMGIELAEKDSRMGYFLGQIEKTVERASLVTRQLLIFSRKKETRREIIDVNRQIVSLSKLLQRVIPKMIKIDLRLSANAGSILADPIQLEQVLMNLALNARDAMPEGGELLVSTKRIVKEWELLSMIGSGAGPGQKDEFVCIQISDTGTGMVPEVRERIFDPFFTTKEEGRGTGLGLAIVYGIVKAHGGWITCESEPGAGTTFSVFFPACKEDGEVAEEGPSRVAYPQESSEVIMLVDDEEQIRDIGKNMLEKVGFRVLLASSGEEALQLFEEEHGRINLVLLDLNMPGIGGFRCLEKLKKLKPDIRVIICTGYLDEDTISKIRKLDVEDFVHKPFRFSEILPIIRARLSQ